MPTYTQSTRPIAVTTPLATDTLLLTGFSGQEGISRLFEFQLELQAENGEDVAFDKLLGQSISVRLNLPSGKRYFHGMCNRVSQGGSDNQFTNYQVGIVPKLWLLTRRAQSRIFQQQNV